MVGWELLDARCRGRSELTFVFCFTRVGHFIKTESVAELLWK